MDEYTLEENHLRKRIDEDRYLLIRYDPATQSFYPLKVYNKVTGEIQDLPPFPDDIQRIDLILLNGDYHILYIQGGDIDDVVLFNLDTFESTLVFQWLIDQGLAFIYTWIYYEDGYFYVLVDKSYGMDVGIRLGLETITNITSYEDVMQPIHFSESEAHIYGLQFINDPSGIFIMRMGEGRNPLYFLEFQTYTLKEFCYSIEDVFLDYYTYYSLSPNEQYMVFSKLKYALGNNPDALISVEILNLNTGEFATIPDANYIVKGLIHK